jgi:proline dehydrogenase
MKDHLVSFDDTETAFHSKSDRDLKRAYWLFKIISFNWLVRISPPFVQFALWARLPVKGLIRATAFRHFCGGENIGSCSETILKLAEFNIGTILDYSVEGKESEEDFDKGLIETLSTISRAKGDKNIPFCVFKPTGFARFALLEKKNTGILLTSEEEKEFDSYKKRIEKICQASFDADVPVFIDAEESWIQDVIDDTATEMMMKFNKDKPLVFNTLQMYRTGRIDYLEKCIQHAKNNKYIPGFKIVRGAYMEKERQRAAKLNIPSPIQIDKASTDKDYNAALRIIIKNIESAALCCGTHNESSSLLLVELMETNKLPNNHKHIWFSQLYGMSDHISYNLANKGYNVCKYVPYGPVEGVLPYLIRRAQENTSVAGQTSRELSLLSEELKRRNNIKRS